MSRIEELKALEKAATESADAMKYESDNNMCALYQSNIVRFNKAIDKAAPALLEIAERAKDMLDENACPEWAAADWARLKAALEKLDTPQR